jgi:hypothetical protein
MRVFRDSRDEDIVQTRLNHLKLSNPGARIYQASEQDLRVCALREQCLRLVCVTHQFADERWIVQHTIAALTTHCD